MWNDDERRTLCIDSKKVLDPKNGGVASDQERTELYQRTIQFVFGDQYTNKLYRDTLKLFNQRLREKRSSGVLGSDSQK